MKRIIVLAFAILLLIAGFATPAAGASGPQIKSGHYDIAILENGDAEVKETWDVEFDNDGTYTRYRRFYARPDYHYMTNWAVSIDDREAERLPAPDENRPANSFAIEESAQEYAIYIYYSSVYTERTFTISYTIENAVRIYDDVADFVLDLTGDNEAAAIDVLTATVRVPQGIDNDDFRIWAHGPDNGTFVKDGESKASLYVTNVYTYQIVDIRVSLPPDVLSGGYYAGGERLDEILAYEKALADDANAKREQAQREYEEWSANLQREREEWDNAHPILAPIRNWLWYNDAVKVFYILCLVAGLYFCLFGPHHISKSLDKKQMPKYVPAQNPEYYSMLPDDTPPAILNDLFTRFDFPKSKSIQRGSAFSATMLDLFAEGFLEMRKSPDGDIEIAVNAEKMPRLDYEQTLVSLITDVMDDGPSGNTIVTRGFVTLRGIQDYINNNVSDVEKKRAQFEREMSSHAPKSSYLEIFRRDKSGFGKLYILLAAATIILSVLFTGYMLANDNSAAIGFIPMLIYGGIIMLRCKLIPTGVLIASQEGLNKAVLWAAFGKFLDDFTSFNEKEFPEFRLWEKNLVYATALGKSRELTKELALSFPFYSDDDYDDEYMHRRLFMDKYASGTIFDTIESIRSSAYSASTSSSDSSGGGGGFSSSGGSSGSGSTGSSFD